MSADNNTVWIYNDVDNEWMTRWVRNSSYNIYHNWSNKLQTTSYWVNVSWKIKSSHTTSSDSANTVATKGYVDNNSGAVGNTCVSKWVWQNTWNTSFICPNNGVVTGIGVEDQNGWVTKISIRCCY